MSFNTDAPRESLVRMVELPTAHMVFRAADEDDVAADGRVGTLEGYAAVFNEDTVINSWEGHFIERIAPGAFAKTLKDNASRVKVLFNHGFDPSIGDKPLGKPSVMEEDKRGLKVEVPLDDTSYNRDLLASLRSGALDGMSFRFSVIKEEWDESEDVPVRTLKEVRLYEFGPVTFPAYEATSAGVRSQQAYVIYRQGLEQNSTATEAVLADTSAESTVEPSTQTLSSVQIELPLRSIMQIRNNAKALEAFRHGS